MDMETDEKLEEAMKVAVDMVNHPPHYKKGGKECIDWIEEALSPEEFRGYLKGCLLKYFWRYEDKGNPELDLGKLGWYAEKLKEKLADTKRG